MSVLLSAYRRIAVQRVWLVWVLIPFVVACAPLAKFGIGTTSIAAINAAPANYDVVFVKGEVIQSFGVMGRGAYQVATGEDSIWVVTESGLPANNIEITVEGEVEPGITLGGRNLGVTLRERQRL